MKTVDQSKTGPVLSEKAVQVGASRFWCGQITVTNLIRSVDFGTTWV